MLTATNIILALLTVNLLTFVQFGLDKRRAVVGGRRIRESTLLTSAILGGTLAA